MVIYMPNYATIPDFSQYVEFVTQAPNGVDVVINSVPISSFDLEGNDPMSGDVESKINTIFEGYVKVLMIRAREMDLASAEFDAVIPETMRLRMNAWLTKRSWVNIPTGYTWKQLLTGIKTNLATLTKTIFVAPIIANLKTPIGGAATKLVDIGDYSIWQVDSNNANLLALHNELWGMSPVNTLGMLAVVNVFGTSFYPSAMRTAVGMDATAALARRNKIAGYLESLGKNTTVLRVATNEGTQVAGIAEALGVSMAAVWAKMVE